MQTAKLHLRIFYINWYFRETNHSFPGQQIWKYPDINEQQWRTFNKQHNVFFLINCIPLTATVLKQMIITRSGMLQFEVLVRKLPSIDGLSPSSIVVCEVSTLKSQRHMIVPTLKYVIRKPKHTIEKSLPDTWTEGSPCGKWILCNQSHVLLCTALWNFLQKYINK